MVHGHASAPSLNFPSPFDILQLLCVASIHHFCFTSRYFPQTRLPRHDFGGQRRTETRQKAVPRRNPLVDRSGSTDLPRRGKNPEILRSLAPPWASAPFFGPPKPQKPRIFFVWENCWEVATWFFFGAFQYWSRFCYSRGYVIVCFKISEYLSLCD